MPAEQLRADGIDLEFLAGELQGSHDPSGVVFTVLPDCSVPWKSRESAAFSPHRVKVKQ